MDLLCNTKSLEKRQKAHTKLLLHPTLLEIFKLHIKQRKPQGEHNNQEKNGVHTVVNINSPFFIWLAVNDVLLWSNI